MSGNEIRLSNWLCVSYWMRVSNINLTIYVGRNSLLIDIIILMKHLSQLLDDET